MSLKSVDQQSCDYYFDSYSHYSSHEELIKDKFRMSAYRNAILENPTLFKGKVVLDAGTGTGILALLAAKCGARKVYAVERTAMADYAAEIVALNGFSGQIEVIRGAVEDIRLPEQVDVILSDWMGFCLLYETMLPAVIIARDRFMRPGGTMFPSRAKLFMVGIEDHEYRGQKIGFWDDVYGFKFTSVKKWALVEPLFEICPIERIITDTCELVDLDLNRATVDCVNLDCSFQLGPTKKETLHAFTVWFDIIFKGPQRTVVMSTSPRAPSSRWYQSIFYLETPILVEPGFPVRGKFHMVLNAANPREQDIVITYVFREQSYSQRYTIR
jgi:protein arginine N-methyltransferase 1